MIFYIGYGCALAAILGYVVLSARWLKRHRPGIDMTALTVDTEPETATVEETLQRVEPYRQHADEAIAQSRQRACVGSQDFLDAQEIRRQLGRRS